MKDIFIVQKLKAIALYLELTQRVHWAFIAINHKHVEIRTYSVPRLMLLFAFP
jgi:hypothetical protein